MQSLESAMAARGLGDKAAQSRQRAIFSRWFSDDLREDEEPLRFADTEMAAVNKAINALERRQSIYIHDPLPSNDVPIAVCLAYLRSQDPRFPSDGIIGRNKALLVLPCMSRGYVTRFDELELDGIGKSKALVERESIQRLSQVQDGRFYTAKHGFEFDTETWGNRIGAVFIDLRKAEWKRQDRRIQTILGLLEADTPPLIFYTDDDSSKFNPIKAQTEEFHITSELLTTANVSNAEPATTKAAGYERLLTRESVDVTNVAHGYPDGGKAISQLRQMKERLQEQGLVPMEVGWVYNLLTQTPVTPEYWQDAIAGEFYQSSVRDLVSNLRGIAQRTKGQSADLLINYTQGINHLQGVLNKSHPVQEALLDAIAEAERNGIEATIVVKDEFEQQALLHAINMENGIMPEEYASIRPLEDVEPQEHGRAIYARPFGYHSHPYQFPLRPTIVTHQFETWKSTVESELQQGLEGTDVSFESETVGQIETPSQTTEASAESLREAHQKQSDGAQSASYGGSGAGRMGGETVRLKLFNGETRTVSEYSKFPVLRDDDIARVEVGTLSTGDEILLLNTATNDIYDMYIDSAHDREKIRKCERTVQQWRDVLREAVEEDGLTSFDILYELQDRGSEITSEVTIQQWVSGHTLGPKDDDNVERVLDAFQPELKPRAGAILQSMKEIRKTHQQIGQEARRAAEAQFAGREMATPEVASEMDIDSVEEDVRRVTIQAIDTVSNE